MFPLYFTSSFVFMDLIEGPIEEEITDFSTYQKSFPVLLPFIKILSHSDLEKLMHALIFSKLPPFRHNSKRSHLQLVQNLGARLLIGFNRQYPLTSVLVSLHRLLVRFKINFMVFTFKAHLSLAPKLYRRHVDPL